MKMHLHPHPRRTLRRLRRLLCAALMVLSLTSVMSPLAAAADLDDGLSSGGTTANLEESHSLSSAVLAVPFGEENHCLDSVLDH